MALVLSSWALISIQLFVAYVFTRVEASENDSRSLWRDGPCSADQYRCFNDHCISKYQFCNGKKDCEDNSDEQYCSTKVCPPKPKRFLCHTQYNDRCIPLMWLCDGTRNCQQGKDEQGCPTDENALNLFRINNAKSKARKWILGTNNNSSLSNKWGAQVARKAVAWYLGEEESFLKNRTFMSEVAYEVSLSLLSRVASKTLKGVSSSELATHVNAFLVTCVNPRHFYGMDLVKELRERADASNETHPSVTLALCTARDEISYNDVAKTLNVFQIAKRNHRTDVEALAVLALSCAGAQDPYLLEDVDMTELTAELKKKQYRNGTVESLKTTALVMQALYASERDPDDDNFNEKKALLQILNAQMSEGSFGNMINTYYVLPVLAYKSLVNVSSSHCVPHVTEEKNSLQDFMNLVGLKSRVTFSLWIGNNRTVEKTITLNVPFNTSFYGAMEWAARLDTQYRFEYSMRDRKPYIYSISGIQDNPENNFFWFLYSVGSSGDDKPTLIIKSPADVFPTNGQHLVFWYKSG